MSDSPGPVAGPSAIPEVELARGYSVPRSIVGCWQLAEDHGSAASSRSDVEWLLALAAAGYRAFDCADIYTGVERTLGELRRRWSATAAPSDPLLIHTKFVPDLALLPQMTRETVERGIDRSLRRLGVERLDLVQFHWWDFSVPGYVDTALWLEEQRRAGKIRFLGLTNFDVPRLSELLAAGVQPISHQVQYSVLDRRPENGMAELCREHGIGLICYGVLAGGYLTDCFLGLDAGAGAPANRSQVKYRLIVDELGGWDLFQELLGSLAGIARKHSVGISQVATRWILDCPGVAAVLLGASPRLLDSNSRALFDLRLDEDDRREMAIVLGEHPGPAGDIYDLERLPGGRHSAILRTHLGALV